jgi:hypothetical protein
MLIGARFDAFILQLTGLSADWSGTIRNNGGSQLHLLAQRFSSK